MPNTAPCHSSPSLPLLSLNVLLLSVYFYSYRPTFYMWVLTSDPLGFESYPSDFLAKSLARLCPWF